MESAPSSAPNYDEFHPDVSREIGDVSEGLGLYAGSISLALLGVDPDVLDGQRGQAAVQSAPDTAAENSPEYDRSEYEDLREYLQGLAVSHEVQLRPGEFEMRTWQ